MTRGMKFLIAGLGLSLAFNFLIIGFIAGNKRAENRAHVEQAQYRAGAQTLRALASIAPQETRREMRSRFRDLRRQSRQDFHKMAEQRREIEKLLRAETIDGEALQKAFDDMHALSKGLQAKAETLIIDLATDIPADDRRALMDRVQENREKRRQRQ